MTKSEFFHQACISIASQAFASYPDYNKDLEPYYDLTEEERESYDPFDVNSISPSKKDVWLCRVVWCAEALTHFIDRNWQTFDDSDPFSHFK